MKKLVINGISFLLIFTFCLYFFVGCRVIDKSNIQISEKEFVEAIEEETLKSDISDNESIYRTYILNINSKKIHKKSCGTGKTILPENRKTYKGEIEYLYQQGYTKCKNCFRGD